MENVDPAQSPVAEITPHAPPVLAPELPPVGGRVGPEPEHFCVDEVPLYPQSGKGEHHYLHLKKRLLTTPELVRRVARATSVHERDIGYAGMKDKHAVTSQWLSLPSKAKVTADMDLGPGVEVLAVSRHDNKLRTGHLLGNRFTITLVDVHEDALARAEASVQQLRARGLPNYFGAQRFGNGGRNLQDALTWLARGARGRGRFEQKLFPSVIQSEVFNRYLSARLALGLERLLEGEVVRLEGAGAMFRVDDVATEQPRYDARDLHLTGPMIGPKMRPASAAAFELERRQLEALGLDEALLATLGRGAPGARRDLFAPLPDLTLEAVMVDGALGLNLRFTLPSGGYATEVIRQLTHADFLEPERRRAPHAAPSDGHVSPKDDAGNDDALDEA